MFAPAFKYENIYNAATCQKVYLEPSRAVFNIKIFCADGWTGTDIDSVLKLCGETFKIESGLMVNTNIRIFQILWSNIPSGIFHINLGEWQWTFQTFF